ncbi:hypothetical protein BDV27DRAFT_73450 [Aspergillus caelatus]|uniref:Uncharacterized protein n=1 Tax=Aspergillus caelatus TaxID=61420 RepID=A0A5N7AE55_9EURO|nr:uncharacterized protein BDV27DRAFT_73450 [Aspergillus caelatus]KAE8367446.1 hypothetical protein BDV27DRAFT_73450 [Aspergillus caelatus]
MRFKHDMPRSFSLFVYCLGVVVVTPILVYLCFVPLLLKLLVMFCHLIPKMPPISPSGIEWDASSGELVHKIEVKFSFYAYRCFRIFGYSL